MTGLHYDHAVIKRRLVHLLESVEVLRELSHEPLEHFLSDRSARWALEFSDYIVEHLEAE